MTSTKQGISLGVRGLVCLLRTSGTSVIPLLSSSLQFTFWKMMHGHPC